MEKTVFIGDAMFDAQRETCSRNTGFGSGDFELIELLSDAGGMALVYLAFQKSFGRKVVAKQLRPDFSSDRNSKARQAFRDEGRKMASLGAHPNIVQVHYYDDDNLILYMEYIDGATLDACIAAQGRPPAEQAVAITLAVLDGLSFIHKKDIIHLDIKPANLFILGPGRIKISDFGIASPSARTIRSGTPGYCSPEQASGSPVGPYSDVYATAILLFELLSGRKPFSASTMEEYASAIDANPVLDVRATLPWLSAGMCSVLQTALSLRPEQRFQTAQGFHDALAIAWDAHVKMQEIRLAQQLLDQTPWARRIKALDVLFQRIEAVVAISPADAEVLDLHSQISLRRKSARRQRFILGSTAIGCFGVLAVASTIYLRPNPGEISISMDERVRGETQILANGNELGLVSSGRRELFKIPAGRYEFRLSVPGVIGLAPKFFMRELKSGETAEPIIYSPPVAYVLVASPNGVNQDCFVDGRNTGYKSPCSFNVAFGEHTFVIGNSGIKKSIFSSSSDVIRIELP